MWLCLYTTVTGTLVDPSTYGDVSRPILMDNVKCLGTETNLLSCPQLQLNATHDCTHMEDVAISCTGDCMAVVELLESSTEMWEMCYCCTVVWGRMEYCVVTALLNLKYLV